MLSLVSLKILYGCIMIDSFYVHVLLQLEFQSLLNALLTLQALIALKKGAQLLKYGRKGKPKFCPFRLSHVSYRTCSIDYI